MIQGGEYVEGILGSFMLSEKNKVGMAQTEPQGVTVGPQLNKSDGQRLQNPFKDLYFTDEETEAQLAQFA